jgi:hypothetical protein
LDGRSSTALRGAAYWGQLEAAELLLDAGTDPAWSPLGRFL